MNNLNNNNNKTKQQQLDFESNPQVIKAKQDLTAKNVHYYATEKLKSNFYAFFFAKYSTAFIVNITPEKPYL